MQTKYETEKKDLAIVKQQAELFANEAEKKSQQTFIFSLIGLVVLVAVLAYFISSLNKIKAKARWMLKLPAKRIYVQKP